MNTRQRNYAAAKAFLETCEAEEAEKEAQYIRDNNITNEDGSTPERLYMIEDESLFDSVLEDFTGSKYDLSDQTQEAKRLLKIAEDELIEYCLNLFKRVYPKQADTLEAHRNDYNIREKLIDLAFKLDTRIVK